jgi:hypothetical protein
VTVALAIAGAVVAWAALTYAFARDSNEVVRRPAELVLLEGMAKVASAQLLAMTRAAVTLEQALAGVGKAFVALAASPAMRQLAQRLRELEERDAG